VDEESEFVIDTNVIIFLRKRRILDKLPLFYTMHITWVSLYEFLRGLKALGKSDEEIRSMKKKLEKIFNVLWPSNRTVEILCDVWNTLRLCGIRIDDRDLFIGVLCIEHNLPLWTFNESDFKPLEEFGLKLIHPKLPDML